MRRSVLALPICILAIFTLAPAANAATLITPGDVYQTNYHFTLAGSPYILDGPVYFRSGTLVFDADVVVKFRTATSSLTIHGDAHVESRATRENPVHFTSYRDDERGGDTNGDGNTSTPAPGDWAFLSIGCGSRFGSDILDHFRVHYGGAEMPGAGAHALKICYNYSQGGTRYYELKYIEVANNLNGLFIRNDGNTVTVSTSSIHSNVNYGVDAYRGQSGGHWWYSDTDFANNWWGSELGPASLDNPGDGDIVLGEFNTLPFLTEDPLKAEPQYEECCSSVVFLPGFEGSTLSLGDDQLWPPTLFHVDEDMAKLQLNEDGSPAYPGITVGGITETFYTVPIYREFATFMDGLASGDEPLIRAWIPLAYDWRYSPERIIEEGVQTTGGAVNVVESIETLAEESQTGKVILVAHSNGGLVGKAIIKKLEEEGKDDLVDAFVMVGSPQLGTPKTVAGLLHGEGADIAWHFITFVDKAAARTLGYNLESAHNLLPSRTYFSEVFDPPVVFDTATSLTENWRDAWGIGLNSYTELSAFLVGDDVPRARPPANDTSLPEVLRPDLVAKADAFHESMDVYTFPDHIRIVQVAGWGLDTIKRIEYTERHGRLSYEVKTTSEGDGTIVYPSAIAVEAEDIFFDLETYLDLSGLQFEHADILESDPVHEVVRTIIERNDFVENAYLRSTKPNPLDASDKLLVSTHSPVLLGVRDEYGNFTGIDPTQDPSSGVLFITENIPGSAFFALGESQYVFLPKGGEYIFALEGTGEGETTVEVAEITNDVATSVASYTDIPTTPETVATFETENGSLEEAIIGVDTDGDGSTDALVASDDAALPLPELLALLKDKVNTLDVKEKIKRQLLKRIANLEKKMEKKKERSTKIIANFQERISTLESKEKIAPADADDIETLLAELEIQVENIVFDEATLAALTEKIHSLDAKASIKRNLEKRVKRLENTRGLAKTIERFEKAVTKKTARGRMTEADAQVLLELLAEVERGL